MAKKKKENEVNFSQIVDEAVMILQRKSDNVMTIKQVADYLGISMDAVRKRCQRGQLTFHRSVSRLYFSRMEIDDTILDRELLTKFA
ncbi:MAG: helix-turn-helix domain-containing protein [Prevotella sp.]|nr:helix-turn-helix domain-containing protein [Prevotella sp.]